MRRARVRRALPCLVLVLFCAGVFLKPFGSGDELWNYNFARGIAHGLRPYTDISMIQTPLSAYIAAAFLRLFGDGLLSFRIAGFVLMAAMNVLLYALALRAGNSAPVAFAMAAFVDGLHLVMWIYNYNYLLVCLTLLAMLHYLGDREHPTLMAVLFGLFPLIKQSSGAVLLLAYYLIELTDLAGKRKTAGAVLAEGAVSLLPGAAYLAYLAATGGFRDFWAYAVLGVGTFTHRATYLSFALSGPVELVFALFPWAVLGYAAWRLIFRDRDIKKGKCFILAAACLSFAYPLCDHYHFCTAVIPLVPLLLLFTKGGALGRAAKALCFSVGAAVLGLSLAFGLEAIRGTVPSSLAHYEGIPISRKLEEGIKEVDAYILELQRSGKTCLIADESAAAYMIPLGQYHKNWDMLLVGNVGQETAETLLEGQEDTVFLLFRDRSALGMQAHYELIGRIAGTREKTGEVLWFDVYEQE